MYMYMYVVSEATKNSVNFSWEHVPKAATTCYNYSAMLAITITLLALKQNRCR